MYTIKYFLIIWISLILYPVHYKPLCIFFGGGDHPAMFESIKNNFYFEMQYDIILTVVVSYH